MIATVGIKCSKYRLYLVWDLASSLKHVRWALTFLSPI